MEKKDNTPLWVFLAFSSIQTRKGAFLLTMICFLGGLGFLPLPLLLDDWSWMDVLNWSGMFFAMVAWYWFAMRWVDKNGGWEEPSA